MRTYVVGLTLIQRYWLGLLVTFLWILTVSVDPQARALAQEPTRDVNTVPALEDMFTPTPTATTAPVLIVTATPVPGSVVPTDEAPGESSAPRENEQQSTGAPVEISGTGSNRPSSGSPAGNPAPDPATDTGDRAPTARTALVTAELLNLRAAPDIASAVIDQVARDSQVTLLRPSEDAGWWYICCGTTNGREGWASAQHLLVESVSQLTVTNESTQAQPPLQIQVLPQQRFVWQGQPLTLQFLITNPKSVSVRHLFVRTDLPADVSFLQARTGDRGEQQIAGSVTDGPVVSLTWPELTAGTQVTATLDLQIAPQVADGSFVDIVTAIGAEDEPPLVTLVTMSMPPSRPPSFR